MKWRNLLWQTKLQKAQYYQSISDVKAGITNDEAVALMDSLIENNIFENSKGRLVSKYSSQITERQVTKFTVQ